MAIAPSDNQCMYITDFTKFYRTTDGGKNWVNLTSNLPATSNSITSIWVDAIDPLRVWITFGGYNSNKAFESTNGGESWTNISSGLPPVPANTIIQNKLSKTQQLYAGTDLGVFFKDGNSDWTLFSKNLPSVIVTELEIHYDAESPESSVLYASPYGRGLWKTNLSTFKLPEIKIDNIQGPFYVSNDSSALVQLSFTINEEFNSNTFTAFLSDENGDFTSPIIIGILESDIATVIDAVIPAGTVSGTRYMVKIVSSDPEFESSLSNPFIIVLDTEAPAVTITSDESNTTSSNNVNVTITFSEAVTDFEQSDIVISNAEIKTFSTSNAPKYLINISPIESGTITIDIPANVAYDIAGNWNQQADQWAISYTPTSIPDLSDFGVTIYPNPTSGQINIEFDKNYNKTELSVLDLTGKVVYKNQLKGTGSQKIDLTFLAKGVYIVSLNIEGKDLTTRLVIR